MKFISVRELRNSTARLDEMIRQNGSVVVTNGGKPSYLMLGVTEESFEDIVLELVRLRAITATRKIQNNAELKGLDKLSLEEINDVLFEISEKNMTLKKALKAGYSLIHPFLQAFFEKCCHKATKRSA